MGADNCVHFRPIKIARDMGDFIEVADGLSSGESVALNISNQIAEGQKVTPVVAAVPTETPPNTASPLGGGPE